MAAKRNSGKGSVRTTWNRFALASACVVCFRNQGLILRITLVLGAKGGSHQEH